MSRNGNLVGNTIVLSMGNRESIDQALVANAVMSDNLNRIIFESSSSEVYLVGGYLRDIILGRPSFDRDFVIRGNVREFAARVASILRRRPIEIGKKNLVRIVTEEGAILDFLPLDQSILRDLSERDFAVNALAWSPMEGLIDPHGGLGDLEHKIIRVISEKNITSDPVRILRAYRLSGELTFTIEHGTRNILKYSSNLIAGVKPERITLELFRILNLSRAEKTLNLMLDDGMLEIIFYNSCEELLMKLKVITKVNDTIDKLPLNYKIKLYKIYSQSLTHQGLLRLEVFLEDTTDNILSLSRKTSERVSKLSEFRRRKLFHDGGCISEIMYGAFKELGEVSLDYLVLNNLTHCLEEFERFDEIVKDGYLSTAEIMAETMVPEGKKLGQIIERVRKAQFLNKINSKEDAYAYIREMRDIDII